MSSDGRNTPTPSQIDMPLKLSLIAFAFAIAAAPFAHSVEQTTAGSEPVIKNVVLVHGAMVDGSYWQPVFDLLRKRGYNVTVAQPPLTGFAADVAATERALALLDGPAILVGHSYGGAVVTVAGQARNVEALVYVAAHVPDVGESVSDLNERFPSEAFKHVAMTSDGYVYFARSKWREFIAGDLPEERAAFAAASQVFSLGSSFLVKMPSAAWREKPSYGLITLNDKTLSPELQRYMYERARARTKVVAASHSVVESQPGAVVELIELAARAKR